MPIRPHGKPVYGHEPMKQLLARVHSPADEERAARSAAPSATAARAAVHRYASAIGIAHTAMRTASSTGEGEPRHDAEVAR